MTKKVTPRAKNTQIRVVTTSAKMIAKEARRLYSIYTEEHLRHGLKQPSSRVAIDWMIYELSRAGVGKWPELNEKNNLYMMITADAEEE